MFEILSAIFDRLTSSVPLISVDLWVLLIVLAAIYAIYRVDGATWAWGRSFKRFFGIKPTRYAGEWSPEGHLVALVLNRLTSEVDTAHEEAHSARYAAEKEATEAGTKVAIALAACKERAHRRKDNLLYGACEVAVHFGFEYQVKQTRYAYLIKDPESERKSVFA